jgi:hypothetical protein
MGETTPSRVLYRVRGARLLLLPAFAMLLAAPASARILNVPSDYPDIRAAVGVAVSGDSIQIAPGTYVGGAFVHDEALTIGSRYMTTGDTSFVSQTVLDGVSSSSCGGAAGCAGNSVLEFGDNAHGSAVIGLTISNGENGIGSLASIVDVLHCRVVSNGDGLDYSTGSGGTFSNNLIENNSDDGIDLNGKMNVNVVNNIIRNNGDDGIEFRLYAFAGGGTASTTFSFNRIYGNGEDGIQFIDYPAVSAYTLQVDHNIFTANFDAGGSSAGIGITPNGDTIEGLVGAPMAERLYVLHNTFIGEKNGLVGGANVIALDNIFANTQGSAVRHVSGSSIVSYGMFWNNGIDYETSVVDAPHLLHVNPLLNTDGTLGAGSPAIDAGAAFYQWNGETVLNEPPGSYTGTAPDLGAVEFGSTLNQPPVVSVSASLTVTLPAQAPLGGTVTDDGRPAPPSLKFAWSVVSGSGPMAIQEPDQLQTRASFSLPGTYVVRLTVSDGALSSSDVVSITVLPSPNTAPLVNAGPDQTITLPADAALHGTASDDRLPNPPGTVSVVWMKNSGPGTVTFQNVNAADTRASFTSAGVYVLILIASDGALTARDTTRVTVLVDPNRAPAVNAGLDQTFALPAGTTLAGTVTDDGLPNPPASVTIAWSKGSGPGTVTLGTPGATTTSATFSATGTYVLRLTANDGALATTDSVQIVVQSPSVGIDRRIAAASDDTEEETTSGSISGNTSDIELVTGATPQIDGLRFTNITVARGSTIASAYIQFEADEAQSEVTNLTFQGHAADNAPTFTTAIHDVSARPRTVASANWSPVAWAVVGEQGPNQRTGDLKAIVQEIVNRPGWVSGNAIAIIVSGTGHRTARSFESVPAGAALLHIESGGAPPGNAAPLVDAGFNQTITLPATAGLAGSVSDDGLPNPPGVVTVSWSKGSGPGTVSFLNPNAVSTSASFSTSGTYVLRLTANDGALTTTDSVQITVLPVPNSAPLVDAGPNQTITLPASATLSGSVSDDGKPNPPGAVTVTWTKGSGPGTVSFANANAVSTTATFSLVGTYILRLTASDGSLTTKDSLQVTVLPHNFPPTANAGADQAIVLPANASLAGSASDDGLPNPPGVLTTTWSSVSGPGPVTFQNASQPSTSASFTAPGVYLLRLNASDGSLSRADTVQITVLQGSVALERRIATGTDDAEESATGTMNHTSVNLQLVFNSTNQIDGLRFAAVTVPKFAVILTAYVQFTANIVESGACSLVIQGQAADNAATFAGTSFNVSSRPRTADSVTWVPPPWTTVGAAGANQRTPELKTILQGIVNRSGWVSGNALVLIVHGTGVRTAYSYDGSAAQAALLHVEYATTGPALAAAADSSGTPDDPVVVGPGPEPHAIDGAIDVAVAGADTGSVTRGGHAAASVEHAVAQRVESAPLELGLRSIGAIPARGAPAVECALPEDAPATLEVHDIAGRRIASRELGSLGAGRHLIALEGRLPAGVYIVRLTQAGRARIVKLAILP